MTTTVFSDSHQHQKLRSYAVAGSAIACLIAIGVLIGWGFNIDELKHPVKGTVAMNPMTAVGFLLAAAALGFTYNGLPNVGIGFGIAVVFIGLAKLIDIETSANIGLDRILFSEQLEKDVVNGVPNRMAPNTALSFLTLGIAAIFTASNNHKLRSLAANLSFVIHITSIFSVIGYAYGVKEFYGFLHFIPMALHTAFCFLAMSLSVMLLNSNYGFMQTFTSSFSGGTMARMMLPAMIFVPATLGYIRLWMNKSLPISLELGVALLITAIIVFFFVMVLRLSIALNRADEARTLAERNLLKLSESLERTVKERTKELWDYKQALDASSIVAITNERGIIVHANDNFCKISKFRSDELIGKDHRIINSRYHPKEFIRNLWQTISSGKIWRGELRNKAKDGTIYWVDTTIVPFLDQYKKPYRYVAIRSDITARKAADDALHELNQTLEKRVAERTAELQKANEEIVRRSIYFEKSHDAFLAASFEGHFIDFNQQFQNMLGFSREEILKTPFITLVHPDDVAESEREIEQIALRGSAENFENRFRKKNGEYIRFQWNVRVHEGLIYAVGRDVSLQKQQQTELVQQAEKLDRANRELESFSYSVSHDLRAPLRAVHGYAQMLAEDYGTQMDAEANRIIGSIMNNAKKMGSLIDDLLSFSRLGRRELVKMNMKMWDTVENLCTELNDNPETQAKVKFIVHPLAPAYADSVTIKQVWINLISNALKYSRARDKIIIEIDSKADANEVVYSIRDNGVGFDMKYVDKLFGVFQRLHSDDEFEGTGVGLAIVKRVISKHGGRVWAEGEIDKGATFFFSLPVNNET